MDLYKAAIGSIVKYSIATLRTTEMIGGKMQQLASKCLSDIALAGLTLLTQQEIEQLDNNKCRTQKKILYPNNLHGTSKRKYATFTGGEQH